MVLDVSIDEIEQPDVIRVYPDYVPDLFTVHVDSKRILTVLTDNDGLASKWLTEVLHSKSTNTKPPLPGAATTFHPDSVFVGLVAEEHQPFYGPKPYNSTDHCLDLLTLCVSLSDVHVSRVQWIRYSTSALTAGVPRAPNNFSVSIYRNPPGDNLKFPNVVLKLNCMTWQR